MIVVHLSHLAVKARLKKRGNRGAGPDGSPVREQKLPAGAQHVFFTPGEECAAQQAAEFGEQKQTVIARAARPEVGLRLIENDRHLAPEHFTPRLGIKPQQSGVCGFHVHASLDFSRAVATRVSCFMRSSSACRKRLPSDVSR